MASWGDLTSGALVAISLLSALAAWTAGPLVMLSRRHGDPFEVCQACARWRVVASPGFSLLVVTGLVYLNQVLFTVYVIRVHGGDPSFVAGFLPAGWFDLAADNPLLLALARAFPAPELLAPTVLRVQAFLELPFRVAGLPDDVPLARPALYLRVARSPLIWLASASYTLAFGVIEWTLRNPYHPR